MAKSATPSLALVSPPAPKPRNPAATTAPVIDIDVRRPGRKTHSGISWHRGTRGLGQGKVWIGYFHLWTEDASGRRVRVKKEKKLGLATMPKHEAQKKLAEYIEEYTGKLIRQGELMDTFEKIFGRLTPPSRDGAALPRTPGETARIALPFSPNASRICFSDRLSVLICAIRFLAPLQIGQIPVGGMTQSMRRRHPPQVQLSMPAR